MKKALLVLLFALSFLSLSAQPDEKVKGDRPPSPSVRALQEDLDGIMNDPNFRNASLGACVVSLQSGEMLYHLNENKNFIPASNLKLLTTVAALEYLGPDFTYTTTVYLDGVIKRKGEFTGNIIVRGAGDPTMSNYFRDNPLEILEKWAEMIDSLGIRTIRGNIIGDDSYFDDIGWGPGWGWDDIIYPFSARVSALSFNDNQVDFSILPGREVGAPAIVSMIPDNTYISMLNNVTTSAPGSQTDIVPAREASSNVVELTGTVALDTTGRQEATTVSVTVDNPTLFMMSLFRQTLEERGIHIHGGVFTAREWSDKIDYTDMRPVCDYTSPPLSQIVKVINTMSHNLCAEALFKTMAKEATGTGSFEKGAEMMKNFVTRYNVAPESMIMVDGSGLSRFNLITPKQVVSVLSAVYHSQNRALFTESLAMPGEPGTLSSRMKNSRAQHNVFAKTGSMEHICSLSGYIASRDKELMAFSIILNNFTVAQSLARNLQDLFCMRLASFSRK